MITKPHAARSQAPTCPSCPSPGILAQPLCLLVGHIDVVEATEEGGQDDHEDEHESGRGWVGEGSEQVSTLEVRLWKRDGSDSLPDSVSLVGKYSVWLLLRVEKVGEMRRH